MREAVIVSTARTPIGKAYRGAFNNTPAQELAAHSIAAATDRAGIDPIEVDDVVLGVALQQGATGFNIARQAASPLAQGERPVEVAGVRRHSTMSGIGEKRAIVLQSATGGFETESRQPMFPPDFKLRHYRIDAQLDVRRGLDSRP